MDFSKRIEKESKKYGVAAQSLILADLMSVGYTEAEAYSIAYAENAVLSFQQNQSIREGITKSGRFKEVLNDRIKNIHNRIAKPEGEDVELISIEEAAAEVLKTAMKFQDGSKERGEMFVKYTELLRKNAAQPETEDDGIGIYLPLKCFDCPLLQEYTDKQAEIEEAKKQEANEETKE